VDRLIPADHLSPGGKDAGCAVFIDRQLAGSFGKSSHLYNKGPFLPGLPTQGAPGRTAIAKASTASCGTNCSTAKSSVASRKPRSSSNNGATTTTPSDPIHRWDIGRPRRRLLCLSHPI